MGNPRSYGKRLPVPANGVETGNMVEADDMGRRDQAKVHAGQQRLSSG